MRYYDVTATRTADGTPHGFVGEHVSEWSLKTLRVFFARYGVTLHEKYTYSINDRPLYVKDELTGELRLNQGEVV